jgi:4-hydroxyphenylacetate 3-monooxygenase
MQLEVIMGATSEVKSALRNGDAFKESLRDGRVVYVGDQTVEDVTREPSLGPGIDTMAEMFDDQFDQQYVHATTYFDEELGTRVSRSWQAPRTPQELRDRRRMIEYTAMKTAGTFGRPPDLGSTIGMGLLARKPLFAGTTPTFVTPARTTSSWPRSSPTPKRTVPSPVTSIQRC